ncbi:hypothetical protein ACNKHX_05155 [Shigella flexneri]
MSLSRCRLASGAEWLEYRRQPCISFHIRFNRPSSLFGPLLVAGGRGNGALVINELARQCGHHFDAEGIMLLSLPSPGLKPLVGTAC